MRQRVTFIALIALGALACSAGDVAAARSASTHVSPVRLATAKYSFRTLDDPADPTFNQLLGINHDGIICGYYGSGVSGHPNQGYTVSSPYGKHDYQSENFPGAMQTQVVAINNRAKYDTAGFYVDASGNNFGFIRWNGAFKSYKNPATTGTVNQLLGLSDVGEAVGFYTDSSGVNHGYTVHEGTNNYEPVTPPGGTNVTAAGINRGGDVTGFYSESNGTVVGFIRHGSSYTAFSVPGATATTPFGIAHDQTIVGSYIDGRGATHGFVLTSPLNHPAFTKVDDPNGVGSTVINGINDAGDLVGFYVDASGNTDGFLATP